MPDIKTVYIAGRISGDPYYKSKFQLAQAELEGYGFIIMSPAVLPHRGFSYEHYMRISSAMLDACDAVYFLPGWEVSKGAMYEMGRAIATRKPILNGLTIEFEGGKPK